jgi:DNA-binding MarR family transcriptional regulator
MRHPVTDIALLAYIAKKNAKVVSYNEATKACKSSSSASRALHQLIREGLLEPKPKLTGLRYVTQYVVTSKGKQVAELALQLTQLREVAKASSEPEVQTPEEKKPPKKQERKKLTGQD